MTKAKLIDHLAGLIQGCEVPRSLGNILGAATVHFDAIHDGLSLFGYHPGSKGHKEIARLLRETLVPYRTTGKVK
jgi:hypothetical protein